MAKINKIQLPDGTVYDLAAGSPFPLVKGTQTAATGAWTGVCSELSALTDGTAIRYWLPFNGSGNAALNLTLANGTATGAKNCYWKGTTRLTTHYPAGSVIFLTYRENVQIAGSATKYTGWWASADFDSTVNYQLRFADQIKAKTALAASNIVVCNDSSGYFKLTPGTAFDIAYPLCRVSAAVAAGKTSNAFYIFCGWLTIAHCFAFTAEAHSLLYIKGRLNGTKFTPDAAMLTCTLPTAEDGFAYMLLGYAFSTTMYDLFADHPIFMYKAGAVRRITDSSAAFITTDSNGDVILNY